MTSTTLSLSSPPRGTVVVAVNFDDHTEALVRTAAELATEHDLELRLVHVEMPLGGDALYNAPAAWSAMQRYQEFMAESAHASKERLDVILDRLALARRPTADVLFGDTVNAISEYCKVHRANLVMTAINPEGYTFFSQGFSTTLGLMAHAPLPVLVASGERRFKLTPGGGRILIADDLEVGTEEAVRRGYELATKVRAEKVRHVHVQADLRYLWSAAFRDLGAVETQLARDVEARGEALKRRGSPQRELAAAAGVAIESDVRSGKTQEEIAKAIETFRPDLVVFGRHQTLHQRGHLVGRITCRTMLEAGLPVLVVPPAEELYANLALPGTGRADARVLGGTK